MQTWRDIGAAVGPSATGLLLDNCEGRVSARGGCCDACCGSRLLAGSDAPVAPKARYMKDGDYIFRSESADMQKLCSAYSNYRQT